MTSPTLAPGMGAEYVRLLDAKDEPGIHDLLTEDAQLVDERTRRWVRGRDEVCAALRETFTSVADVQTTAEDVRVTRWDNVQVETFVLRQVFDLPDGPCWVTSPTTLVWRRVDHSWRLVVIDSIPTCG